MIKTIAASTTALVLVVGTTVYAQQPSAGPDFARRPQFRAEDRAAFVDARIAALHAGLRLTPEQEKSWPAFEQAYRDLAASRRDRFERARADREADPVERARRRADALAASSVALKRYADAAAPLYQSFDEGQKRRFEILSQFERPFFRRYAFWRGERAEQGDRDGRREEFRAPR